MATNRPIRILGIDPGTRVTGYGCVEIVGNRIHHVSHGALKLGHLKESFEKRLLVLFKELNQVIEDFAPTGVAVEKVFFAKNAVSALKLGHARGVVLLASSLAGLDVFEYNPTEIKKAIVGHGRADKMQVAKMMSMIFGNLRMEDFATHDASDALALAMCHAMTFRQGPQRQLKRTPSGKRISLAQAVGIDLSRKS